MKQSWEWNEDDLLALIASGTKESIELDYKACDALAKSDRKKNDVGKDVSALANSAGGTLVYGMLENGYVATALDGGFDPAEVSKEWLEQVINSRIQRRIDGVRIAPVELTKTHPGKVAYVVWVPQSLRAPHQAADKRFYKRFNFESVPMEEYEVRDVARRADAPDLRMYFMLRDEPTEPGAGAPPASVRVRLEPVITNDAATPAEHIVINIYVDARLTVSGFPVQTKPNEDVAWTVNGQHVPCYALHINWGVPGKMPVFERVEFRILDHPLLVTVPTAGDYLLVWQVKTPRMPPKEGHCLLRSDGTAVKIAER
jgi:hypothetical protein